MRRHLLITSVLAVLLGFPLSVVYATENCCFGTTCPTVSNCNITGTIGNWQCKTTCPANCADFNQVQGCCQFRNRTCTYTQADPRGPGCPSPFVSVIDVSWSSSTHCYLSGGGEAGCLQGNTNAQCMQ
jgi:hypothetical protein